MKNFIFTIILVGLNLYASANFQELKKVSNIAFTNGEKLSFRLFYSSTMTGNVTAGEMISEISSKNYIVRGDTTLNIKVIGKTKGAFSWFFKVNDVYQTYVDVNYMIPRYFIKRISEGDYEDSRDVKFYHEKQRVDYINNKNKTSGSLKIGKNVQDLISAIYYARTFNTDTFKLNDDI